jgi:peptide/nickel transport system permease protein
MRPDPVWQKFRRNRAGFAAALFLAGLTLACLIGPPLGSLFGLTADALDLHHVHEAPSLRHWLGTDELGRDLLLRLLRGGQVSLAVGLAAALASALIGMVVGLLAGYRGGAIDSALMRLTDTVLALPTLPVLIVLSAADVTKLGLPKSFAESSSMAIVRIVVIVALFGWTVSARLVRGATLSAKAQDYVRAARALGLGDAVIMQRHILPNILSPLLVAATLSVGTMILTESTLSFLGLGIQPPQASWGNMLTHAQELIYEDPKLALWPGVMIFATVIAFNFIGDGLQTAFDPRRKNR